MKKNILIHAGLILALLTSAAITSLSYWHLNQLVVHDQAENFTLIVIQNLDTLLNDLREVKADQRGYTRSGDEQYLKAYHTALRKVGTDLKSLALLTEEQPHFQKRLDAIETLVKRRLSVLERKIDGNGQELLTGGGEMAELRSQVTAAKEEATGLMRELSARQKADFTRMERWIVFNSAVMLCMFITIFQLLRRDIAWRIRNEQELVRHTTQLEEQVMVRTDALVTANRDLTAEISNRERIEDALRLKEKKYRSLFENSLDAVILAAPSGEVVAVNRATCEMFGMTEEELINVGHTGIIDPADDRLAAALEEHARTGSVRCELDFLRMDGSRLSAEVSSIALDDGVTSFVILHDITERKWAEEIRRNLDEYENTILEQERLVLSREVHDEIGQNLTALKLDLFWIERKFSSDNGELAERLTEMRANLDQLILKTQKIAADLRPPLLDNLGLVAAIEWQAHEFERRSGIECHRMLKEDIEVCDGYAATTIMRIFQEALANIIRHAGATEVSLSLCERADKIVLEISDNGRGITMQEIDSLTAYGLMGMRERAHLCQGELSISGAPGEGTTVRLLMPRIAKAC